MKHFRRIAEKIDVSEVLGELTGGKALLQPPCPVGAERFGESSTTGKPLTPDGYGMISLDEFSPAMLNLLDRVVGHVLKDRRTGVQVWNPKVAACPPHGRIQPHRDNLATNGPVHGYRHQLAIQSDSRAYFRIGQERARFKPGELWLCDVGDRIHEMTNGSDRWRYILRFDVYLENEFKARFPNLDTLSASLSNRVAGR